MSTSCSRLTDEEKARLVYLLSDINGNDKFVKKPSTKTVNFRNAFKFNEVEKSNLKTINCKLRTLQEICDAADSKGESSAEQNQNILDDETGAEDNSNNREWEDCRKAKDGQCRQIDTELDQLREETDGGTIICNDEE